MAYADFNADLPASAHPMAKPGFGKRTPGTGCPERSSSQEAFAHLPEREKYLASFIDRLPEGAAIDVKTLAKSQPLYGQQACRSALRELSRLGHLRRVGGLVGEGRPQHVTRTYFSRTARDERWWAHFLETRETATAGKPSLTVPNPVPAQVPEPPRHTEAYAALAALGRRDSRLVLSAAECAELEVQAREWLARDADVGRFASAMTAGLPSTVHSPVGLVRKRLTDKLPPLPTAPEPSAVVPLRPECTDCGRPGTPESLPGGLCRPCRAEPALRGVGLPGEQVRRWATLVRGNLAARQPPVGARPGFA